MTATFISLLTDFGARDPSAGIVRGVIASIAPEATVIDISHEVRKFSIRDGALLLWCALPYFPVGVHVAVIDPGVGTERRPVALRTDRGDTLVGPDNGLLRAAADRLGGITGAHVLESPQYRLPVVSASFHGRDVFAPAAAHLAGGVPIEALGPAVAVDDLVPSPLPDPRVERDLLVSEVVYIDTFGNVKLAGLTSDLEAALGELRPGEGVRLEFSLTADRAGTTEATTWEETFGSVPLGSSLLYEDSYGRLCLADNQGNAAERLGLVEGQGVRIERSAAR